MNNFVSQVFSHSAPYQGCTGPCTLLLRPSLIDSHLTIVHPEDHPDHTLYTVRAALLGKEIHVFQGNAHLLTDANTAFGHAHFHTFSSKTELSLRGQPIQMKTNMLSGNSSFETATGQFKWKLNPLTGNGLELHDGSGTKLAKIKTAGITGLATGGEKLEISVPCNEGLVELIILTGMAAKKLAKESNKLFTGGISGEF